MRSGFSPKLGTYARMGDSLGLSSGICIMGSDVFTAFCADQIGEYIRMCVEVLYWLAPRASGVLVLSLPR